MTAENDNLISVDEKKKYMEQSISFIDEYGNPLKFDLQSQQWTNGVPGINSGGVFDGYTVYPVNNGPDVDVNDDASAQRRDQIYDDIYESAEKYFDKHPEERPKDGYSRRLSYITSYVNIQAYKEMKKRENEGQASSLEKAYVYQHEHPQMKTNFSWEQLTGKTPLDAPEKVVLEEIRRDELSGVMKRQEAEYKQSVERGTQSIANRVAEAQNLRYEIKFKNRERPQIEENTSRPKKQERTMSLDEVNAAINHYVQKNKKEGR